MSFMYGVILHLAMHMAPALPVMHLVSGQARDAVVNQHLEPETSNALINYQSQQHGLGDRSAKPKWFSNWSSENASSSVADEERPFTSGRLYDLQTRKKHPGLLTLYTNPDDNMELLIDVTEILRRSGDAQVMVTAMAARGTYIDGIGQLLALHTPIEETANTIFKYQLSSDGMAVDVFQPQLDIRTSDPELVNALNMSIPAPWVTSVTRISARGVPADTVIIDGLELIAQGFLVAPGAMSTAYSYHITEVKAYPSNVDITFTFIDNMNTAYTLTFSIVALPEVPMTPRAGDDRLKFFTQDFVDLGVHAQRQAIIDPDDVDTDTSVIWRYNITAQPEKQIRIHIDPTVPERWRQYFREGIEAWNDAFKLVGHPEAMRAVSPDDADWPSDYDAGDARYDSISWIIDDSGVYSMGVAKVDPRSGQILTSDIIMSGGWVQAYLTDLVSIGPRISQKLDRGYRREERVQDNDDNEGKNASFLHLSLLLKNGFGSHRPLSLLGVDVPNVTWDSVVGDGLRSIVMHEVGHILGLRHNFKGSVDISFNCTQNKSCSSINGLGSSVMDYYPMNVPSGSSGSVDFFTPVLGAYDKLAIQYGYTAAGTNEEMRDSDVEAYPGTLLAFLRDAEAYSTCSDGDYAAGQDPLCEQHDMSDDPIRYYNSQLDLVAERQRNLLSAAVAPGEPYWRYGEAVQYMWDTESSVGSRAVLFLGGANTSYVHRGSLGSNGGREAIQGILAEQQLQALTTVLRVLRPRSSGLLPPEESLRYLIERGNDEDEIGGIDFDSAVERRQQGLMDQLLSGGRLRRMLMAESLGGLSVGAYLSGMARHVFGAEDGTDLLSSTTEDWSLHRIFAEKLISLQRTMDHGSEKEKTKTEKKEEEDAPEIVASISSMITTEALDIISSALSRIKVRKHVPWLECRNETGDCICDGKVHSQNECLTDPMHEALLQAHLDRLHRALSLVEGRADRVAFSAVACSIVVLAMASVL